MDSRSEALGDIEVVSIAAVPWPDVERVGWCAVEWARLIEGYPVDADAREKSSSAELYHGTVSLFESARFTVVSRPTPSRALMRLEL